MTNTQEILAKPFDIETHKKTFVNYLEVVVNPEGIVEYATPSHQEKLIREACTIHGITRNELNKRCPPEFYFDFIQWLCNITGYLSLWRDYKIVPSQGITEKQQEAIDTLIKEKLYYGN